MSDRWRSALKIIVELLLCLAFVILTIIGQRITSWGGLGLECIGLVGIVFMLWLYNYTHK